MANDTDLTFQCPIPITDHDRVQLAHGGGGKLMHQLIEKMIVPAFQNPMLNFRHDGAVVNFDRSRLAFSADSFVVRPLFFPGGDIGTLAITGTVNDLAMCGALPLYISVGFILEEGLPMRTLWQVVQSMQRVAKETGVHIITGDTKVVDRGKGDGVFIHTSGIGIIEHALSINPYSVRPGDAIVLSGDLGRHGIAIMGAREGLAFEGAIESDCASVSSLVQTLLEERVEVHCMRDLTRGGLATALIEIAETARAEIHINERKIPVHENVRGACEMLGLDPLYVANEGRFVAYVPETDVDKTIDIMRAHPSGADAVEIGHVGGVEGDVSQGVVTMKTQLGTSRMIDMLSGEQLPRIC